MIYFINTVMPDRKTGVEFAQLKRMKLFRNHNQPAKIITRLFENDGHKNYFNAGLKENEFINLFEWLQGTGSLKYQECTVSDLKFPDGMSTPQKNDDGSYSVFLGEAEMYKVVLWNENDKEHPEQVHEVIEYDFTHHVVKTNIYDVRGFKTQERLHQTDDAPVTDLILNPDGQIVYESFWLFDRAGNIHNSQFIVRNFEGRDYQFNGMKGLTRFFLNQLNLADGQGDIFISDRNENADWGLLNFPSKAYKILYLHNVHSDAIEPMHSTLNWNYQFALNNINKWDAIIASTQKQLDDLTTRFHQTVSVFKVPVGIVPDSQVETDRIPLGDRNKGQIIAVCRIAAEKRLNLLIDAFAIIKRLVPWSHLDFYGNPSGDVQKQLTDQVSKLNLSDSVKFHGYITNVNEVESKAQLFGVTSAMEGFNLAMLEANSNGVPLVSFDVRYGPSEIIQNNVNGYVVPMNDVNAIATSMAELLLDDEKWQRFSTASYENSERFSEDSIWKLWQPVFADAKEKMGE